MIPLSELLSRLGYDKSRNYRPTNDPPGPETAHLFRAARDAGVSGIYTFETRPGSEQKVLSARPAVYVSEASSEKEARQIHRSSWNLGYAPFLIVRLPHQIRIYTGFDYSEESEEDGLLGQAKRLERLQDLLADFTADSIDTGRVWKSDFARKLDPNQRVDKRLLKNLEQLGQALRNDGLRDEVAHALIGKYVYISYLRDHRILSDEWLAQQRIAPNSVFTAHATVPSLRRLTEALEVRFNGKIFPIEFRKENTLKDEHVSWVASVFCGAEIIDTAPDIVRQLHLPFKAYDFQYIPVETLSAIYEQFIYHRKEKGAIYTPEVLADYLLSEVEWAKPLARGMKILDPACGSGVFLVLAYRRLIEKEMSRLGRELHPEELCNILLESIYGVERERDACYVTEFSLILTLLHYVEPPDLQSLSFHIPDLHNNRIFQSDFFDLEGEEYGAKFWQQRLRFDWVVGNPPWIEAKAGREKLVRAWMESPRNKSERPVGGKRVAEAFSWLITDLLAPDGMMGLILPATSLVNLESQEYRQHFFTKYEVLRITNFANLRDVLFDKRGTLPAATIVYHKAPDTRSKTDIVHYGPFSANQVSGAKDKPWVIVVNENEIQTISPYEAEKGETCLWKLALWGTYRDKRAIERLRYLFPTTLEEFCEHKGWGSGLPRQGAEFCNDPKKPKAKIKGQRRFDPKTFDNIKPRYRFSVPHSSVLKEFEEDSYLRRGEDTLALTTSAPHIILSPGWQNYAIYSDEDFVIPPRQMVIAAPGETEENEEYLRALVVYLSSSMVAYYLFFQVPEWGVFRQRKSVVTTEVRRIPTPNLTLEQARELADLHRGLVETERQEISHFVSTMHREAHRSLEAFDDPFAPEIVPGVSLPQNLTESEKQRVESFVSELRSRLQLTIDRTVFELFRIPKGIRLLAEEFVQMRLFLDKPSAIENVTRNPSDQELLAYALELRDQLDDFVMGTAYHRVTITYSNELIECAVEITQEDAPIPVNGNNIKAGDLTTSRLLAELGHSLRERVNQWVYVQRGLRLFDGPRVYIYKTPRLIDWTRTQAMNDAGEIIGESVAEAWYQHEISQT